MNRNVTWLTAALLLGACNCNGENNETDTGADMATADDMSGPAEDMGNDDAGGDMSSADDMNLPEGVSIPELGDTVTVRFDEHGVLHVACETATDCYAAQGYYHAAHRFIQMDVNRRFSTGRLSGLIGNAALNTDVASRTINSTRDGQPVEEAIWESASENVKDGISAYTRGVNAWLDDARNGRNGATLSAEYDLELVDRENLLDWTETDSVACGVLLVSQLSQGASSDLRRGEDYPELSAEQAFDLLGTMSATQVATMPASGETYDRVQALQQWPNAQDMRPALDRLRPHADLLAGAYDMLDALPGGAEFERGSNNWVLSGSVTSSGNPIMANDPHLGLSNPALWYLVELNSNDDLHIAGVSLPGLPGVLLGHNENISWGGTVVFFDLADVYIESLTADGSAVNFDGGTVDIIEVEHTFDVARSNPITRTLRYVPHHGPVLQYDPANNEAVSLRWAGNDARTDIQMFFELFTASTVDEARDAIKNSQTSNQNWVVADRDGNIGWFPFNDVPERSWASLSLPPWLPLPGDGSAEWGELIPKDDLPQMVNPANGYIGTANTDPTGTSFDGDPTNEPYGYLYSYGEFGAFRQDAVIRRIVDGGTAHTPEISMDMQGDSFLVLRDWVSPHVQDVIDENPGALSTDAEEFWSTLETWNGECPSGIDGRDPAGPKTADPTIASASIGCAAFHYLLYAISEGAFGDELADTRTDHDSLEALRTLVVLLDDPSRLQAGDVYWDNTQTDGPPETRDMIILAALETATTRIREDLGTATDDWRWGKVHTLTRRASLFNDAGFTMFDEGPHAAPGGAFAINVANPRNPSDRVWDFAAGPSMRHVSDFTDDGIVSYWTLPGGQRHIRDSEFYDSLLDDWLATQHFQMPFQPADVEAAAIETVEVSPR